MSGGVFARMQPRMIVTTFALATLVAGLSCTENLPSGPATFGGTSLQIVVAHDTIVVGDTSVAAAKALDASGSVIQALSFSWTSSDTNIVGLAAGASADAVAGRTKALTGRRTGISLVSLALPDPRFAAAAVSRNETVVVGGVRILTARDTTLTAINDTGRAIAAGLVRANGALVPRASQGLRWTHVGANAAVIGQGDTVRYIARSNGIDFLIASHDFCLLGGKCADTTIVRVSQQLTLALSNRNFLAWSFGDSLGPAATLADRRGTGLAGTSLRLVPLTPADSAIVRVTAPIGVSNPATGALAAPRLVAIGNGTARVAVRAIGADGSTIVATDTITETVRQVARRVAVEPIRGIMSVLDSLPIRTVARDARGFVIADAVIAATPAGVTLRGAWVGPSAVAAAGTQGTVTPTLSGAALPESNPLAPQVVVANDAATISITGVDTVKANATAIQYQAVVYDSALTPAIGAWVRFRSSFGASPDSAQTNVNGVASVAWVPRTTAGLYTLTGVRSSSTLTTLADSAGRIVLRRSVQVVAGPPDAAASSVAISATTIASNGTATITVTIMDAFGNPVFSAVPADFTMSATRGTIGVASCTAGICTATYTAPATAGVDLVTVQIGGVNVTYSPLGLTIT